MTHRLLGVAALLLLSTACTSQITGNNGNFVFSYPTDDNFVDFNKAVAVGAFLDLTVTDSVDRQPVTLVGASFTDETLLTVTAFSGSQLTLQALTDGGALLEVEGTTAGGETLVDSVNMRAATPDNVELRHSCHDLSEAYYLVGQRVWLPFELRLGTQPAIGYGYYPVDLSEEGLATLSPDESNQQYMAFDTVAAGDLVLSSQLDDTTATMRIVGPEFIDGALEPTAFVFEDIDVGDTNAFYVVPRVGATPVCQANVAKTVTSDTPDICDVRDRDPAALGGDESYEFGWFEIEGKAPGTCLYTVTFPDGDNGNGASQQFSYPIEP